MDVHDQNLLDIFESCDDYYQGSLSAAGLHELCTKLKIQDSYHKLAEYLLEDFKSSRFFFQDFKGGLLKLLHSVEFDEKTDGEHFIGKEIISTYGENQLEKRLELNNTEFDDISGGLNKKEQNLAFCNNGNKLEKFVSKKRKAKIKRKDKNFDKSGKGDSSFDNQELASPLTNTMNEVEHLVTAWSDISRGLTDCLSRDELVRVFQCVGLDRDSEEAARCVFEKLGFEEGGRITLQELLEFIKTEGSLNKEAKNIQMELEASQKNGSIEFIEPPSLGCVTGAYLVERWECEGVPGALQLLQNLGCAPNQQIDLSSLVSILSEEIKSLNDEFKSNKQILDPHVALLQANSVLQNLYIHSLKTTIEHLNAEKDKLRNDVIEANQRALFLAQEVDDHHSKLEQSTQQQVKVMEQKHAEKIREITNQAKLEQDALMAQNVGLEKKLKLLEEEEVKNKAVISQLEMEARLSEQEHRAIVDQLTALQRSKDKLEKDLENVSHLQQKMSEMEATLSETDVVSLLERIRALESENTNLRDRNDELSVEIEELSTKLLNSSTKKRLTSLNPTPIDQTTDESICGGAVKRRGDAFSFMDSAEDSGGEEESPRLGKVRKCSHTKDFTETTTSFKDLQIRGNSLQEDFREGSCSSELKHSENEDVRGCKSKKSYQIIPFSKELEQVDGISFSMPFQEYWSDDIKDKFKKIYTKLQKHDPALANEVLSTLKEIISERNNKKVTEVEESLRNRCKELETSLELLKEEYERTEDYWSEKLEEERGFFEEEQKLSDKKYSELLEKIFEYEETLNAEKEHRQRLETIEEKDSLEKQVTDMEQECAQLKHKLSEALREKELETTKLKSEIERLKLSRECVECGVQVADLWITDSNTKEAERRGESTTAFQKEISEKSSECNECRDLKSLLQTKQQLQIELNLMKEERDRLSKQITERKQKLNNCGGNAKAYELEKRCHTLMITLRQQQKQTEDILKNTWRQHKAEVKDLKSVLRLTEEKLKLQTQVIQEQLTKLTKTDLLVKDLFVENAYLISSVQKLEKQYQSSANNSKSSL